MAEDKLRLGCFDVVLAGCNFRSDGSSANPTLQALRTISADPSSPPVILLTASGSEYTAVQAIKAGAFDYIAKQHMSRDQIVSAVQRALISSQPAASSDFLPGVLRLFGYDIRRRIASNGNVSVHVAFSAERGKEVVIKVLHRGRGSLARDSQFERFVDEFKMLYDIDDPAVAEIHDFRVTDQYCYIAMEYFARGHLGRILNEPLAADDALATAIEIAHALSIIHMAGVIHCDLKPGNIMLRNDGSVGLIDFGISQSETHTDINRQEGKSPIIAGTPYYMSPEQALGSGTDERTDLYSLGVILFQMLTGEKPYTGDTYEEIIERHKNAEPPRLPAALSAYQDLINRLMAKDMAMRLGSARELVEILENLRIAAAADEDHPAVTAQAV